jgi:oxygen-independent coproporphyrinogen III oxidase
VDRGELPIQRGHVLDAEDLLLRRVISDIVTRFEAQLPQDPRADLRELQQDGLIELRDDVLRVTERGRPFLRNICMAFDARTRRAEQSIRNDAA